MRLKPVKMSKPRVEIGNLFCENAERRSVNVLLFFCISVEIRVPSLRIVNGKL